METIPIISSGLFAGAAAAVSLAEHPARMSISMPEARKQFNHSYNRLAPFQVSFLRPVGSFELQCSVMWLSQDVEVHFICTATLWKYLLFYTSSRMQQDP